MGWMLSLRKLAFSRGLGSLAQRQWRSVLQNVALAKAGSKVSGLFVAHAAIDQHEPVSFFDEQGPKCPVATVAFVGGV
jgi:hypothetical protein